MTTKSLIAQKLLDLYEERELGLLWKITCEEYRDRNKNNAAYQETATEVGISGKYRADTLGLELITCYTTGWTYDPYQNF